MIQIQDTLVSLDLIERFFCCDLSQCLGECCIEGDAGAPITLEEFETLSEIYPKVEHLITPAAQEAIRSEGVGYYDCEGELVTQIVNGRDCVFTCYEKGGLCSCALEKVYNEGETCFRKPESCALYPVRLKKVGDLTAVNFHRWKICRAAEVLGRKLNMRAYQFLNRPLTEKFGEDWYEELCVTAEEYLRQFGK